MANKIGEIYGFFATKICFFLRKKYFDVPHAIGVLGRTFVEPNTPGLSQRGRLLGAVAQWQLRLCFLKPITDTDTMFPLKVAQVPGLHFRRKKFSKKNRLHGFFKKKF